MENRVLLSVGLPEQEHDSLRQVAADETHVELVGTESTDDAIETCQERAVSCVVTTHELPDGTGVELIERLRDLRPGLGCLLYAPTEQTPLTEQARLRDVEFVPRDSDRSSDRLAQLARVTLERHVHAPYPVPSTEPERQAALDRYEFDDDTLVGSLERLTKLATDHFEMPLSSVNVITGHGFEPVACYGTTPKVFRREETVCTYTIASEGSTVVEDLDDDALCTSMEVVQEYDLRFYAGARLLNGDGRALGTFCVFDRTPRTFSADDRELLELYATEAMAWIEQLGRSDAEAADVLTEEAR